LEFNPNNKVVKLCLQGMGMADKGDLEEASQMFVQAWDESTYDFEKFISAHFVAKYQDTFADKLSWLETALNFALTMNDDSVKSALPALYENIAECYEGLGDPDNAKKNYQYATSLDLKPTDKGPFYHGTRANLQVGEFLIAGGNSNYRSELKMNHIYFTAIISGASLAAALAKGELPERIYIVEPTGEFENDPNVTDKKFPGNPTRSYRSEAPLKVVGELTEWERLTPEELQQWRARLAKNNGEIIN